MLADLAAIVPELALLAGAVIGLLTGMFLPRRRQWVVAVIAAVALLVALGAGAVGLGGPGRMVMDSLYAVDPALGVARVVIAAATLLVLGLSSEWVRGSAREAEFHVLMLLGALGATALAGASGLMLLVAAYLLASVPLYALTAFAKDALGTEAALKYYLMGALLGITMLTGVTVLFGATGTTTYRRLWETLGAAPSGVVAAGLVLVLAGLAFKMGAVPGQFWVPDVTEGASTPVAAYVTTIPKVGALVATYRLLAEVLAASTVAWPWLLAALAAASMTLGNLAAFWQQSPKRLLAYSTVSQVGYLLMAAAVAGRAGLALPGLLFYLAAYAVTNLGAFAVVTELPRARTLRDYAGLWRRRPGLAVSLIVCLLGFIGTPPTAVFVGKLALFTAAVDGGFAWLAVVAVINTVASVFYYLRWIVPVFLAPPEHGDALTPAGTLVRACAHTAAAISVALGLSGGAVLAGLA